MVIIGVPLAFDRLADLVVDEFERAGTENILFIPARVLVEDRFPVNEIERVGERRQKCAGGKLQIKNDGVRIGRPDLVDHQVIAGARTQRAFSQENDLVEARGDVGSRH